VSILFSDYKKDNPSKASYFRIGYVVLSTPPTDILTSRVVNNERLTVLRGSNDMVAKTGQARWDFTVRWTALLDDSATSEDARYQQWEDLRSILAMFRAAPFVEVENGFIRQVLSDQDVTVASSRLAFALRQMRVSTHNDIIDALDVSLTMTLFNYFPYSFDFGYLGSDGQSTDAWLCPSFKDYINQWKAQNLDATKDSTYDGSPLLNWRDQIDGTVKFRWREYQTVKIGTMVTTGVDPAAVAALNQAMVATTGARGKNMAGIAGSGQYDSLIQQFAAQYGVSPAMVKAVMGHESNFQPNAVGANFKGNATAAGTTINQVTASLKGHIQTDADGGLAFVNQYTAQNGTPPDLGLMQINWKTGSTLYTSIRPADLFRPETNIAMGAQYLSQLYAQGMTDNTIWKYNTGAKGKYNATEQAYATDVLNRFNQYAHGAAPVPSTPQPPPPATPAFVAPAPTGTPSSSAAPGDSLTADQKQEIINLVNDGWWYDHAVNDVAFFYREQQMTLTDSEHGDIANGYGLIPSQFSILFVNNIAQIPLAGYQYPTYQHIGSASSKVSMLMMSKGERASDDQEPVHSGISVLTGASEFLESQYLRFRNHWRRVSSIHRMQAFYVENKILNMLGIRGITIDGVDAQTLPGLADTAQVDIAATQYENVFEDSTPFKIQTIDSAAASTAQSLVSSGQLSSLSSDEAAAINEVSQFAQGRASGNAELLIQFLQKLAANPSVDFSSFSNLTSCNATQAQISTMTSPFAGGANSIDSFPGLKKQLTNEAIAGKFTYGDCLLLHAMIGLIPGYTATGATSALSSEGSLATAVAPSSQSDQSTLLQAAYNTASGLMNVAGQTTMVQAAYDATFPLLASFDSTFATQINTLAASPKFSAQFAASGPPSAGPGSDPQNKDHGAYKDLGLKALTVNGADFNPGYYFYNHNADYLAQMRQNLEGVVQASAQGAQQVNTAVRPDAYDIAITESLYVGQNADVNSLVRMTNIPGYDMAEAFPTFKLFLMEDSAEGIMQAFDNFYSYASVIDIEIMRYLDKPDLARLQITNIANILQHKLLDNSLQGKWEQEQYRREFFTTTPGAGGEVTGGNASASLVTGKTASNQDYQLNNPDMGTQVQQLMGFDMRDGVNYGTPSRVPLQYVALQPGTKIQVRMGYSNNPDLLTPVFTGHVTDIQGDVILTIEAESYTAELCDLPTQDGKPVNSKVYGGWWPWHDSGDVASVVENLLHMDNAKHFGRFKLSTVSDPLIQGLTWENRVGKMIGEYSVSPNNVLTQVGAAMVSSYDRSAENILINHVINHLGAPTNQRLTRDFYDQGTGFADLYLQFDYKIPDNSNYTIWELIRDICRRYPEYLVTTKQYGFPYSADATLVVGHPLDWYFARLPMLGDDEAYRASTTANAEFTQWWNATGQTAWNAMLVAIKQDKGLFFDVHESTPTNPQQFYDTLTTMRAEAVEFFGVAGITKSNTMRYLDQLLQSADNAIETTSKAENSQAVREIDAMRNMWLQYLQMQDPKATDRLKPIRRYHFIDHQSIVHNGIRLNEKIYNGIRVGSKTSFINGGIKGHYQRVLDVTDLVVDSKTNVEPYDHIVKAVQQSFMKEEVGKMYEGEIILRGVPEIEPGDDLVLLDPSTAIVGIVEVDRVIQSFNQETGYTTICYPKCATAVNEAASANVGRMFCMSWGKTMGPLLHGQVTSGLVDSAAVGGVDAAVSGGAALAAGALIGGPPAWVLGALIGVAMLGGMLYAASANETLNMIEIMPVTRWGRPWMGGLEGYQIGDVFQNIQNSFQAFKADEVYPLLDAYRFAKGAPQNTLPVQSNGGGSV